jgi:methylenetetrahydrofolate reductase (NADPH)
MSNLQEKFKNNEFPVTTELFSIKGTNISSILKKADMLSGYIDAFNITDNHRATMRAGSLGVCVSLLQKGHEPVFQITCRDRNRLALQSDLLSASILGIKNVLFITGDHLAVGDHPEAKAVFDIDSVQLLQIANKLEQGFDASGKKLKGSPLFFKGGAVNLTASPEWLHLLKVKKKIIAGAEFFQTQLIFDIKEALSMKQKIDSNVMAGVTILKSAKFARFLKEKVPGMFIPDDIIDYMERAGDELEAGKDIAINLIKEIANNFEGLHIMALGLEEHIPEILKKAGIK